MTIWADEGAAAAWVTLNPYFEGDHVLGIYLTVHRVWIAENDGTSDVGEPVWNPASSPIPDDSVTWDVIPTWAASTSYVAGDRTQPTTPNGHSYLCLGSGDSGGSEPTWSTVGADTDDGGTGSDDGSLFPPDGDDNDAGTGDLSTVVVGSKYVYQLWENPALDMDAAPIGVFHTLEAATFRTQRNDAGSGSLTINIHSDEFAWVDPEDGGQDRIVTVHRESDTAQPIFAWILEESSQVVVTPDEEGGETITWTGRGSLALLERAIMWYRSVLPNGGDLGALPEDDPDGMWHWVHKRSIAILVRQLEEARYRGTFYGAGRQDSAIPNVYWTFSRYTDSNGDPVDNDDADAVKYPVLDNLFADLLGKLITLGLLIRAVPVVNGDGHLRIRLDSWVNDPGVSTGITFTKGVNIDDRGTGEKKVQPSSGFTDVLVQGDIATGGTEYEYRVVDDPTYRTAVGRREFGLPYQSTPTHALLDKAGERVIALGKKKHAGPTTIPILERTDELAFVDYIEWDYVTVDIPGAWDSYTDNIFAIAMTMNEVGEWDGVVEFSDEDPRGVVGMIDPCNCASGSEEPPG